MGTGSLRRYPADVARAFAHAPFEVVYALVVAAGFSWALEAGGDDALRTWWHLVLVVLPAAGLAWTGTLLHALGDWSSRRRWAVSVGAGAVAAAYGALFLDMDREAQVWRAAVLVTAVLLVVVSAPALGRPTREEALLRFRRVDGRMLLRMIGAALYAGALFVGLALAIGAVNSLFELQMEDDIYGHVFGWIAFAVAPWIVAGGLPELVRPLEERGETMALVHRVAAWLVLPLLVLYYGILYAYSVRILVLGELPSNLVSPLVGAAALLAGGALVLFDRAPGGSFGERALRFTPVLFLPLVALGVYAVALRVSQYGWTEFRYVRLWVFVGLAGLAVAAALQALRRHSFSVHLMPAGLGAVLAVSVVGPWGAPAVARRSQHARLVEGLADAGVLRDGTAAVDTTGAPVDVPAEVYDGIGGSSRFLVRHFGSDAVTPPLPAGLVDQESSARDVPTALGLARLTPRGVRMVRIGTLAQGEAVETGAATAMRVRLPARPGVDSATAATADSTVVTVHTEAGDLRADLAPLIDWLRGRDESPNIPIPAQRAVVPLTDGEGRTRGRLLVLDITAEGTGELRVSALNGMALIEGGG